MFDASFVYRLHGPIPYLSAHTRTALSMSFVAMQMWLMPLKTGSGIQASRELNSTQEVNHGSSSTLDAV